MPDYNVIDALFDSLKGNFVDEEVKIERRKKCDACEKQTLIVDEFGMKVKQCSVCWCLVDWATAMPGKSCPIGKWNAEENKK